MGLFTIILAVWRLRQEDYQLEASLGYTVRLVSKTNKKVTLIVFLKIYKPLIFFYIL